MNSFTKLTKATNLLKHSFGFILIYLTLSGCAREGCTDSLALNWDSKADKSNQEMCEFSSVTFYAGSDTYEGIEVEKITLRVGQDTIGVLTSFNHPTPTSCGEEGTLSFDFGTSGVEKVWFATLILADDEGEVNQQGTFEPDPYEACIKIDVMP